MFGFSAVVTIVIVFELFLLFFQLINYLGRTVDLSRKRFLWLIVLFLLNNIIGGSLPNSDLGLSLLVQGAVFNGIGIVLASYYFYYIVVELDLAQNTTFSVKWLVVSLSLSFVLIYFTAYFITSDLNLAEEIFLFAPILIGIYFCVRTVYFLIQKWNVLKERRLPEAINIICSNLGIIFMATMPITELYGSNDLNILMVNISLLLTGIAYIQNFINQSKLEYAFLQKQGFEEGPNKNEDILLNLKQYNLSSRELEVALLIFENKPYKEIGEKMFITPKTVSKHASNIFKKTHVSSREGFIESFYLG